MPLTSYPLCRFFLLLVVAVSAAHAQTEWQAASGAYNVGANWQGGSVPAPTGFALIDNGGTVTLGTGVSGTVRTLLVGRENGGTVQINGGYLNTIYAILGQRFTSGSALGIGTLNISNGGVWDASGPSGNPSFPAEIAIGGSGAAGFLNILDGGTVIAHEIKVGKSGGGMGTLRVTGGLLNGYTASNSVMWVGYENPGLYEQTGGLATLRQVTVGSGPGVTGTATVSSGTMTALILRIGDAGTGVFRQTGGLVRSDYVDFGIQGGTGTLELAGGVFEASTMIEQVGAGRIRLDGGTLRATANNGDFFKDFETGDVTLEGGGGLIDTNGFAISIDNVMGGTGRLTKLGNGTLTLTAMNSYSGGTTVSSGTLAVSGSGAYIIHGSASMDVGFSSSDNATLEILNRGAVLSSASTIGNNLGAVGRVTINNAYWTDFSTITVGAAGEGTFDMLSGLAGSSSGIILGAFAPGQGAVTLTSGTLQTYGDFVVGDAGGGTFVMDGGLASGLGANSAFYVARQSGGSGSATVNGGTLATNALLNVGGAGIGGFVLNGGYVSGTSGVAGVSTGARGVITVNGGTLALSDALTLGAQGRGALNVDGGLARVSGTTTLAAALTSGTLSLTNASGAAGVFETRRIVEGLGSGFVNFDGGILRALASESAFLSGFEDGDFDIKGGGATIDSGAFAIGIASGFSGTGGLTKVGTGTLTLSGTSTYSGPTTVQAGKLAFNGANTGNSAVSVQSGAELSGIGRFTGTVSVGNGGILTPGNGAGTMTVGSLVLNNTSDVRFELGTTGDLVVVTNALTIDGQLSVTALSGFGKGAYTIFQYGGSLTNNGMTLANLPTGFYYSLDFAQAGLVRLLVEDALYWDGSQTTGDGIVHGGSGTWNNATQNWTVADGLTNQAWSGSAVAVFSGSAGLVNVADTVRVNRMDFLTDGYTLSGTGALANGGSALSITTGSNVATTIGTAISGSGALIKGGDGGLVTLTGSNAYTGGTTVKTGTLAVGSGGSIGHSASDAVIGDLSGDNGAFVLNGGSVSNRAGIVGSAAGSTGRATVNSGTWSNAGVLTIGAGGNGSLLLNGGRIFSNSGAIGSTAGSSGTATVASGTWTNAAGLTVGSSGTGRLQLDGGVLQTQNITGGNNGTFVFNGGTLRAGAASANLVGGFSSGVTLDSGGGTVDSNGFAVGISSALTGTGGLTKVGTGTLTLTGANSFTGVTTISAGLLQIGDGGTSGSLAGNIVNNDTLFFNRSDSVTYGGVISGTGNLTQRGTGLLRLTGSSSYTGNTTVRSGTLVLDGGTLNHASQYVSVGHPNGSGSLQIINGGRIVSSAGNIGNATNTVGNATVTSGTWTLSGGLTVGVWGEGNLLVNGGLVSSAFGHLGYDDVATGLATVSSGTWAMSNASGLFVGVSGTGVLNVTNTGVVRVGGGTGTSILGRDAGAFGTLNIGTGGTAGAFSSALVTTGSGSGVVNFNHTGSVTFAAGLGGSLAMNKLGAGTTFLTGTSSYTGATTVSAGRLAVNGILGNTAVAVGSGATLAGSGTIGGSVVAQSGATIAPGNSAGTLTVAGNFTFQSGSLFAVEGDGAFFDRIDVGGAVSLLSGANISFSLLSAPTLTSYTLLTAASGLDGSVQFNLLGALPAGYQLVYSGTSLVLQKPATIGGVTVTPVDSTIITGGTTGVVVTVGNGAQPGSSDLDATVTGDGANLTGTGTVTVAPGATGTASPDLAFSSTTLGSQSGTVTVTDPDATNSPVTGTTTVTVLDHAGPSLTISGGNNQTVIIGADVEATLNLANGAPGTTGLSPMDVQNLSAGLSGTTGSAVIGSGTSADYTASLNTGTMGVGQNQTFHLDAGDQQSLPGANPLSTLTGTVTLTVLDHAAPILTIASGNNQDVIVGATGITASLNLANGLAGAQNLSPMDVQNLSAGLSGATGSGVIASGTSGNYTASLNTATVGAGQAQTFSLDAGDQQTLAGANPLTTQTGTVALNVYGHADPTVSGTTLNFGYLHVGYAAPVVSSTLTVTNGSTGDFIVDLKADAVTSGDVTVSGFSGVGAGESAGINATLATSLGVGGFAQTITYTFADDSTLAGASNNVGTATLQATGLVYSGQGVWKTLGGGSWGTLASGFGVNWETDGGTPGLDAAFTDTDTATFGAAGSGVVTLDGASPSLIAVTFDNALGDYEIAQGSGGVLTLNGGTNTAVVQNLNGNHAITAPLQLATDARFSVAHAADRLTIGGAITGAGNVEIGGAGRAVFTQNQSYTGSTTVTNGALAARNLTNSAVNLTGGLFSPGDAGTPAAIAVASLALNGGGLEFDLGAPLASDRILVAGTTTLNAVTQFTFLDAGFSGGVFPLVQAGSLVNFGDLSGLTFISDIAGLEGLFGVENNILFFRGFTENEIFTGPVLSNYAPYLIPVTGTFLVDGPVTTWPENRSNTINSLIFNGGSSLYVFNDLTVTSGNFTVPTGMATVGGGRVVVPGAFSLNGGGTLVAGSQFAIGGDANVNGGSLVINGLFNAGGNLNARGGVTVNGFAGIGQSAHIHDGAFLQVNPGGVMNVGQTTHIHEGATAQINGQLFSPQVNVNGLLKGVGVITGNVVNNGIVAPGNSPGTLTVNGNYTQTGNGTLQIELGDLLFVAGNASLAGRLQLLGTSKLRYGQQIVFLQAGSISGEFEEILVPNPSRNRGRVLTEGGTGVLLIAPTSYTLVAETTNQQNVAKALDSFIPASGNDREVVSIALDLQSAEAYPAAFDQIAPTYYESLGNITIEQAFVQSQQLNQRLSAVRLGARGFQAIGISSPLVHDKDGKSVFEAKDAKKTVEVETATNWNIWAMGSGLFAQVTNIGQLPNYDFNSGGFLVGGDYRWSENFVSGLYGGYQYTWADAGDAGNTQINSALFGGYASYTQGGFYADGIVGGGYNGYRVRRGITFSTIDRTARSQPNGGQFNASLNLGYDWEIGKFTLGPIAGVQYTYAGIAPFTETGADSLDLRVAQQNLNSLRTTFGGRVAYTWNVTDRIALIPEVRMFWQHEFLNNPRNISSALDGGSGPTFGYETVAPARDSVFAGAGLSAQFGERLNAFVYWNVDFGRQTYFGNSVSAGLNWKF